MGLPSLLDIIQDLLFHNFIFLAKADSVFLNRMPTCEKFINYVYL